MKILISARSYPTSKAPFSAFIGVLAEEMVRQGMEVAVIAPQSLTSCWKNRISLCPQQFEVEVETSCGIKTITVYRPYTLTFGQGRFFALSAAIDKFLIHRKLCQIGKVFDVVYAHFWWSANNVIDYAKAKKLPLFVATGEDSINIDMHLSPDTIRGIKEYVSGVISVSTKNIEESIIHGLTDGKNCIMLPNAVNVNVFHKMDKVNIRNQMGISQDDFVIAFCGRFNYRKGVMRVSDAIKRIAQPDVKVIFIGSTVEGETSEPDCNGIIFKGRLAHEKIPLYLNCADVFILPTLAEGCPNSIVEAMACGLPIISSNLPFNYDILNSNNSILVDPLNIEEIVNAIIQLRDIPGLKQRMAESSSQMCEELTIEKRVQAILDFIKLHINISQ